MIVSNSSPLIYLAKIGKLELLNKLFGKIAIPVEVYNEVVKGKEEAFFDAVKVEKAVKDGWIEVKEVKLTRELEFFSREIDLGELYAIQLAKNIQSSLLLIDDASARTIAESFGLNVKGTVYVLLDAKEKKFIDKKEIKELINELIYAGFRLSSELYGRILNEIEKSS